MHISRANLCKQNFFSFFTYIFQQLNYSSRNWHSSCNQLTSTPFRGVRNVSPDRNGLAPEQKINKLGSQFYENGHGDYQAIQTRRGA
jgi:hypothetical protein